MMGPSVGNQINPNKLYGLVEAGGTKFICAIARADGTIIRQSRVPTSDPETTLATAKSFYEQEMPVDVELKGFGIASFGPLDLDPNSSEFGSIISTPKPNWSGVNIRNEFASHFGVPVVVDTDVNCAALAEAKQGAAQGCRTVCYITVGTGIGVGSVTNGQAFPFPRHAEAGHMRIPRAKGDAYKGHCPYHGDCAEGLASGPAMADRWQIKPEDIPDDHVAWDIEAFYVAAICNNLTFTLRPDRIVIGGGVFQRKTLYARVRDQLAVLLSGYALNERERDLESFIVPPGIMDAPPALVGAYESIRAQVGEGKVLTHA